jgi:mycothiol system anti-sigma-R factor
VRCREVEERIATYLDGELEASEASEVARHLEGCAACSALRERHQALRAAVLADLKRYRAPDTLRMRVRVAVRAAAPGGVTRRPVWRWAAVAASAVLVVAGTWKIASDRATATLLTEEILGAHVRSLMPGHLTDVTSSDQHTVKPWFDGKLDFAPPVTDEASKGYPLLGGRLDYVGGRPVAALVYGRRLHRINVFVWPDGKGREPTSGISRAERNGYNLYRWTSGGMAFWAASDLNSSDLDDFVRLLGSAGTSAGP